MDAAVCFSGGKDSTLAALLLEPFFDVTLVTCGFGVTDVADRGAAAADAADFPHESVALDPDVAHEAVDRMVADGYPRAGIQQVHEHALERVAAADYDAVVDGTRRDDRAPTVERPFAQSLEDRHGVAYLAPLAGYGRDAVDHLAETRLVVETGPTEELPTADYETELRAVMADRHGEGTVERVFPDHTQSRVRGRE